MGIKWGTTGIPYKRRSKKNKNASPSSSRKSSPVHANAASQLNNNDANLSGSAANSRRNGMANKVPSKNIFLTPITHFYASDSSLDSCPDEDNKKGLLLDSQSEFHYTRSERQPCFQITQNNNEPKTLHFSDESESENEKEVPVSSHLMSNRASESNAGPSSSQDDDGQFTDADVNVESEMTNAEKRDKRAIEKLSVILKMIPSKGSIKRKMKGKGDREDDEGEKERVEGDGSSKIDKEKKRNAKKEKKLLKKQEKESKKQLKKLEKKQLKEKEEELYLASTAMLESNWKVIKEIEADLLTGLNFQLNSDALEKLNQRTEKYNAITEKYEKQKEEIANGKIKKDETVNGPDTGSNADVSKKSANADKKHHDDIDAHTDNEPTNEPREGLRPSCESPPLKLLKKQEKKMKKIEDKKRKEEKKAMKQVDFVSQQADNWNAIRESAESHLENSNTEKQKDGTANGSDTGSHADVSKNSADADKKTHGDLDALKHYEPKKLVSIPRGGLRPSCELPPLKIKELLPKRMLNEQIRIPEDIPDKPKVFGAPIHLEGMGYLDEATKAYLYPKKDDIPTRLNTDKPIIVTIIDMAPELAIIPERKISNRKIEKIDYDSSGEPPLQYGYGVEDGEVYAKEQLSLYRFNKLYKQNMKSASNPYDIPKQKRETVQDYSKSIKKAEPSAEQAATVEKITKEGRVQRIRRVRDTGSYAWNSVDEAKLLKKKQHILRYTWKGKLVKLKKYLIDPRHDKEINLQDNCGRSACHFAASWDCPKTMEVLFIVPSINVNLQDDEGKTPLYKAVEINSLECVKLLLKQGANPRIQAHDNRNPFEYAIQEKGDDALEIIKHLYAEGQMYKEKKVDGIISHLHQVCLAKKDVPVVNTAKYLIQSGAYINATEGDGRTPLMLAAQLQRVDLVELLLKYKADVKHIDFHHKTAIEYARPGERCYHLLKKAIGQTDVSGRRRQRNKSDGRQDNKNDDNQGNKSDDRPSKKAENVCSETKKDTTSVAKEKTSNVAKEKTSNVAKEKTSNVAKEKKRVPREYDFVPIDPIFTVVEAPPKPCPVHLFYARPYIYEQQKKIDQQKQQQQQQQQQRQ